MAVAQDERAPGADIINELVAVGIVYPGAFSSLDKKWRATNCLEGAHWAVNAPDQIALCPFKQFSGTLEVFHYF
jgi:hypothetical protein